MTIKELKNSINNIKDIYDEQSKLYTSAQLPRFKKQFCKQYNVEIDNINCVTSKPTIIDEIVTVGNVTKQSKWVPTLGGMHLHYFVISCGQISFTAKRFSGADRLNIGQKIHIIGKFVATSSGRYSNRYCTVREAKEFGIQYQVVK